MTKLKDLLVKVEELYENKEYDSIISNLSEEILSQYNDSTLYAWSARAHLGVDDYAKGIELAEKSIKLDANNFLGPFVKGTILLYVDKIDESINELNKSISLNDNFATAYYNRGCVNYSKGDYENALKDYSKAIQINSNYLSAYYNRGIIYGRKSDYDSAINDYTNAIDLDSNFAKAYNNRGIAFKRKKEYVKAIDDFTKAIELKNNGASEYKNRGEIYFELEEYDKAIDDYNQAINLDKDQFKWLEDKVKLAKEKIEEKKNIIESNAIKEDKDIRLKLESEIEKIVKSIREKSKSDVKTVVHYTKLFVAEILVSKEKAKMNYSNAIYMNDPLEGKMLFDYLNDKRIEEAYLNGERRTETSVYLGSFLPAEENNGEFSHEDDLVMWRTYGKDEHGNEAAGCNLVINSDFFKTSTKDDTLMSSDEDGEELLNVIYIKKQKNKHEIVDHELRKTIDPMIKTLKKKISSLINLRNKYKPKDEFYKDIENKIFRQLSEITYLFKSADYYYEHETRIIKYIPRDSNAIQFRASTETDAPPKKFYIDSNNEILPYLERIIIGPKVKNFQQWNLYFDYEIRQTSNK